MRVEAMFLAWKIKLGHRTSSRPQARRGGEGNNRAIDRGDKYFQNVFSPRLPLFRFFSGRREARDWRVIHAGYACSPRTGMYVRETAVNLSARKNHTRRSRRESRDVGTRVKYLDPSYEISGEEIAPLEIFIRVLFRPPAVIHNPLSVSHVHREVKSRELGREIQREAVQ